MPHNRTFRLFISSTFSDFMLEREALQDRVFPRLQEYCASKGAKFLAVDLRWGITEAAQVEHDTLRICLDEIRRSQELSPRPNFAVLLGNRYGWEPIPARIPKDHWDRLLANANTADQKTIRAAYYPKPDSNAIPPAYVLKYREGNWDSNQTAEITVRDALRRCATSFKESEQLPYFASATHQEIVLGAMETPDAKQHVHVYVRTILDLPWTEEAKAFIDWDTKTGALVPGGAERLKRLELKLRAKLPGMVRDYSTVWLGPKDPNLIADAYLEDFCEQFYQDQKTLIDQELERLEKLEPYEARAKLHEDFAKERSENFVGRKPTLKAIDTYVESNLFNSTKVAAPLILYGEGGTGKSAIMAYAYRNIRACYSNAVVLARFIGGVPGCEDIGPILRDLIEDICRIYQARLPQEMNSTKELNEAFESVLNLASEDKPLILFLDAIDQLTTSESAWLLEWLPKEIPSHTRLILTTRQGPTLDNAQRRLPKSLKIVPAMSNADGAKMLDAWLGSYKEARFNAGIAPTISRRLSNTQKRSVLEQFKNCPKPLWLKLVYEEVRTWRSWDDPRIFPNDIKSMVSELINVRLLKDDKHLPVFTHRSLAYVAAGRFGLSEDEIAKALGSDEAVKKEFQNAEKTDKKWPLDRNQLPPILWSRLYFDLAPYLTSAQIDGAILFRYFHREFKEVIEEELLTGKVGEAIHANLATMFSKMGDQNVNTLFRQTDVGAQQQSPALRRIMEEPWQLAKANQSEKLAYLLTNFGYCMAKCSANKSTDLISDFTLHPYGPDIDPSFAEFKRFMQSRANLLIRGDRAWSSGLILLQLASETSESSIISAKCIGWLNASGEQRFWLRSNFRQQAQLNSIVLEGHEGYFDSFITIELQGNYLLSRGMEYKVWDLNTGACISEYPLDGGLLIISPKEREVSEHASAGPSGEIYLWAAKPSQIRFRRCEVEGYSMCNALEISDGSIVSLDDPKTIRVAQKEKILILKGHTNAIVGFTELHNGSLLSWGIDGLLRVWSLKDGGGHNINIHYAPILGALQLTSGAIVSWDFAGDFIWSQVEESNACQRLEEVKQEAEIDYLNNLKEYSKSYIDESMWQRGSSPSDLRATGVQEVFLDEKIRLLTWAKDLISWYDLDGNLEHSQPADNSEQLTGVIFLPGYGTARVYGDDSKIYLQPYSSTGNTINVGTIEIGEPNARGIDGILLVNDMHFCTWSGRKRGDDSLRLWSAIDGDWSKGARLEHSFKGHSRWIHTVNVMSDDRIATCGEDDSVRVWDLKKVDQITEMPLEGNVPRFVGDATWRIHLHDYSLEKKKSLILVDAITSKVRSFDEIQYGMLPPSVQASNGLVIIENVIAIDKDSKLTYFENFREEGRKSWQSIVLRDGIVLTLRNIKVAGEANQDIDTSDADSMSTLSSIGCEITLWVCGFIDTQYWEASSIEITIPSLKITRISDFSFVAWGDINEIKIFQIDLEDFGEQEVFKSLGTIHNLSHSPSGVIVLDESRLLVWAENSYLRIYNLDGAQLRNEFHIDHLMHVVQVSDKSCLAWDSLGGVWEIDLQNGQPKFLINNVENDLIGLVSLTNNLFLCISSQGILRLWDQDSLGESKVIFPGRYISRAQFFWSLFPESEESGLAAGNPMKDARGNTLMMLTFAPAAFSLLLFCKDTKSFYLLVIDEDRVKIWDAYKPSEPICVWQFTQSSYRDPNLELGLSVDGQITVLAGKSVQRLQLMQGAQPCRFDTIANFHY